MGVLSPSSRGEDYCPGCGDLHIYERVGDELKVTETREDAVKTMLGSDHLQRVG